MELTSTPSSNVTIRSIRLVDARPLFDLRLEALHDSPEAYGEDYVYVLSQPPSVWTDLVSHSLGDGDRIIFVAEVNGSLVGMAGANRSPMKNTRHSASVWGVYVQPLWRGKGLATDLVNACIHWGKKKGLATMRLGVITANPAAIHCYEKCGFRACGVDPQAFFVGDRYYDLMRMTLVLD
jgi:RimJ/RimL family protein N-acetyltransferase